MKSITILLSLAAVALLSVQATDYCAPALCGSKGKHIACGNNGAFALTCPAGAHMVNMTPHISHIVRAHNAKRNLIASGGLSGYKPAKRMSTMHWDPELASIAEFSVKMCAMQHDNCRSTDAFKFAGQILGISRYTGKVGEKSDSNSIDSGINRWWNEYKDAEMAMIDKFTGGYRPEIGHFTIMAHERNIRVGCAASRYKQGKWNTFLLACNYAMNNIIGQPIYASGPSASGCTTGKNHHYSSLCSPREVFQI